MGEANETAGGSQELQPKTQEQVREELVALAFAEISNRQLFIDSKQYPPNVRSLYSKLEAIDGIPENIIYPYLRRRDQTEVERDKLEKRKKELEANVSNRMPLVRKLIGDLIPAAKEIISTEAGRFTYPQDNISEIFNRESSKYSVRTISFLLDSDIAKWWTIIGDEEFDKFQNLVGAEKLPDCLVSDEEMNRLWDLDREDFAYEWHRTTDLYKTSHPESANDFKEPGIADNQPTKENAARYAFLDIYEERPNLETAFKELVKVYPNEKTPITNT